MIVKCDKCQTRFKIPDEKVTEKGVKVRCTRCQNTFRVSRAQDPVPPPAAPLASPPVPGSRPDTDPFARFGIPETPNALEATRPGVFPEGIAATRPPLAPSYTAQSDLPAEVFDQPTRVAPVPRDLLEGMPKLDTSRPAFDPSEPLPRANTDFDLVTPAPTPAASPVPPPPEPPPEPAVERLARALPDLPAASDASTLPPGFDEPTAPGKLAAGLLGELPPPPDEFAAPSSGEPDRGLFDMPAPPPAAPPSEPEEAATAAAPRPTPSPAEAAAQVEASGAVERPAGRPEDVGMAEASRPGAVRRTAGLVVNLAVASLLVVVLISVGTIYLNEGKLDPSALSLEPVKALFASPGDLLAVDVSNGLYETKSGKPVFYVRGEVENRGRRGMRARVRVEILDGSTRITQAESLAGTSPTPEELYSVTGAPELAELSAKLDAAAAEVKPGGRVPFLVAFYDYPPQLGEYRLKVTVQEQAGEAAAR